MKLLLWLALGFLAFWLLRRWRGGGAVSRGRAERPVERMRRCEYCGVNAPEGECVEAGGLHYCSPAHRDAAQTRAPGSGRSPRD